MSQDKVLFAHRGGSIENPENTIQAFKASHELGAAIETDVRTTKDGHVIVCHDPNMLRLSGKDLEVADTNFSDIPKTYTSKFMVEFGHHDYKVQKSDVAEFCTLEQLFQTVPRSQVIQIDIKDSHDKVSCQKVRQLVDKYERADTTIIGNGSYSNMQNLREAFQNSNAMLMSSWEDTMGYFGLYLIGLAPFMRWTGIDVLSMPWMTRDFTARKVEQRRQIHPDSLAERLCSPNYWMLTAYIALLPLITRMSLGLVGHLDRRGIFCTYWVLN